MRKILIATSNAGKLRDFAGAAMRTVSRSRAFLTSLPCLPWLRMGLHSKPTLARKLKLTADMFRENMVVADDSGLEIDALSGAPGVHSARYAAPDLQNKEPHEADANTDDEANNARVLRELKNVPAAQRTGRFVCVLAAARDGKTLATFRGAAEGIILDGPRGDEWIRLRSAVLFSPIEKTFAELSR